MSPPPPGLRLLLRLYPARHRKRYGAEMWEVLAYRWSRVGGGRLARARFVGGAMTDLAWNAVRVWLDELGNAGGRMFKGLGLDARFVLRSLIRSPGYTATALLVLTGAVAANAIVFSFVRGTLLWEPPYPDSEGVMAVWGSNPRNGQLRDVLSGPNYIELARESTTVDQMAAFHFSDTYLTGGERPEVVPVGEFSPDLLPMLGVEAALGRTFGPLERRAGAAPTVLLGYDFWTDRLDADPGVVGQSLSIEGTPHTILGVLPDGFHFLVPRDIYTPLSDDLLAEDGRYRIHYHAAARLRPGVTPEEATRELTAVTRRIAGEFPGFEGWGVLVEPLRGVSVAAVRPALVAVSVVALAVLLIALANLSTLFRIRLVSRTEELAVRRSLGAGTGRVSRILLLESVGLAAAGAILGLALTPILLSPVTELIPAWVAIPDSAARVPAVQAVLDPAVAGAGVLGAVLGSLLLTLPALIALHRRSGAPQRRRLGVLQGTRLLVAMEVALATALLLGAGLAVRTAHSLLATDMGVDDQNLLSLWVGDVWDRTPEEATRYYREIVQAVEAVPGVESAAVTDYPDFLAEDDYAGITFLDRALQPSRELREEWRRVSEGVFETTGTPVVRGRTFVSTDFQGAPRVAVVNSAFARKHYGGDGAVGRFLSTHDTAYRELEIVGIVADIRNVGPAAPAPPMLYVPNQGSPRGTVGMYVRTEGTPMGLADAVQEAIWSVDSSQPVTGIAPVSEMVRSWVAIPRATRTLLSVLAAFALVLAVTGVFGVVAFAVRARRSELGVRLALGASAGRLGRELAGGVAPVVVGGIAVGGGLGLAGAWAARALLHGVGPLDPFSFLVGLGAMAAAAALAVWLPARQTTRIDPAEAMRAD